jgi:L-ascorbate metabolism protein UlaG (beta-lactamase superfamily)
MSLTFRWLGVAGVELKAGDQVLAIDPFFTRPSPIGFFKPVIPDDLLISEKLPVCHSVLVTHSHWDHLMDVPGVLRQTGAVAHGSANTCQLLHLLGVPERQVKEIQVGDKLSLGVYKVDVIEGQHSWIPFSRWMNGRLPHGLQPPLRFQDYRMDACLGYKIQVPGMQALLCAAKPQPADVLFIVAQESKDYYQNLFLGVHPHTIVPIHWDNFLQSLNKPIGRFTRPGRMNLPKITRLAGKTLPQAKMIIPEMFREYTLG